MPQFQRPVNFNELFRSSPNKTIVVNDLNIVTEEDQEMINKLVTTTFGGEKLSMLPSCECGETEGDYTEPTYCPSCGTLVKNNLDQQIYPVLWFRSPTLVKENITIPLITPVYWLRLKDVLAKVGFCTLSYLTNTTYRASPKAVTIIGAMHSEGITKRGLVYFCNNIQDILLGISKIKAFKAKQKKILETLEEIRANPDLVFSNYLFLPNKSLLVIEKNNLGIYIDKAVMKAKTAIKIMVGIDRLPFIRNKENRTAKALDSLADMYFSFSETNLKPKPGIIRKQLAGERTNFSARNVAISITGQHNYNDVYLPWCSSVVMLGHHLVGQLLKRNYTLNQAVGLVMSSVNTYNQVISDIFDEFLANQADAIELISQRNPSLLVGSAQNDRCVKIIRDPSVRSVSKSILTAKSMNLDFDGDFLAIVLALDKKMSHAIRTLGLHTSVFDFDQPYSVSGLMALPKPDIATIANYLQGN